MQKTLLCQNNAVYQFTAYSCFGIYTSSYLIVHLAMEIRNRNTVHSRIISLFTVLNDFIRSRTTTKSNDLKELYGKV